MKKTFFVTMLLLTMIGWGALNASAQTWSWEVSTDPIATNVTEITADPDSDAVYGIDAAGLPTEITIPAYSATGDPLTVVPSAVILDLAAGAGGIVYLITGTEVSTWDPALNASTALDAQPIIPTGMTGTYKNIAVGMDRALYVLFENDSDQQYLLKGTPPIVTEGVVIGFEPKTLNITSQGNYLTVDINLPNDLNEEDIDLDSLVITKIEVTDVGVLEGLNILPANAPSGVDSGVYRVKFYRSTKKAPGEDQSISWQLQQLLTGQNKGKYPATITLEGSANGTTFQGDAPFTALVSKAAKGNKAKGNKNK
jgi:hypothetical protein